MKSKLILTTIFGLLLSLAAFAAPVITLSGTSIKIVDGSSTINQQAATFGYEYTSGNGKIYIRNNGRTLYSGLITNITSINSETTTNNKLTQLNNFIAALPGAGKGSSTVATNVTRDTTNAADITGLSFTVTNGKTYKYKAWVNYSTPATTTGLALAVSGQTNTWSYIHIPTNSAGTAIKERAAYNTSTLLVAADAPATSGNVAIVEGFVNATTTGTVKLQFASEVDNSTITIVAGSRIDWEEL